MLKTVFNSLMSQVVRCYNQFKGESEDQECWNKGAIEGETREGGPPNLCWTDFTCLWTRLIFASLAVISNLQSCETAPTESEPDSRVGWALFYSLDSRWCTVFRGSTHFPLHSHFLSSYLWTAWPPKCLFTQILESCHLSCCSSVSSVTACRD